ncbi:hypothetical protein A0W86_08485 [Campylobacter fetus]|nr:hypothetical protein [Campylobacter fetus]
MDIEKELSNELNLPQMQIRASLQYLWDNHANDGMFKNKRDIYNTIKMLIGYQDYAGNSFKNPNMAYIATKTNDKRMSDMVISRDSAGVTHLNKDKKMSETDKNIFDSKSVVETPKSQRKQQVLGVQMNTSKEHYSPTNNSIIPQNSKQVKPTSEAGDDMIAITKLKNEIDELKATKQGGKYLSSQVKAEVIDKSNELGKLIDERISQGKSINQTLVSEYKAQIQRARYQASKEAKPTSAPVKTEVKTEPTTNKYLSGIKELEKVDYDSLNAHQKDIYDVFAGKKSSTILKVSDIDDLATLEQGNRNAGARKIMIKHAGVEKTGGLNGDELVDIEQTLLKGKIDNNSFETGDDFIRYSYAYNKNGTTLQVVINEFNNGKKIFDYYSDRNFIDYNKKPQVSGNTLTKNGATNGIIPQNIDNINPAKKPKNMLINHKNSVGKDTPDNPLSLYSKNIYNFKDDIQNKINQLKKVENSPDKMIVKKGDGFENITETTTLKDAKIQLKKAQAKLANYLNNGNWLNDEITDLQQILELKTPFKLGYTADKEAIDLLCADYRVTKSSVTNTITKQRNTIEKYLNITPIKEFGTNYAEFYHDGSNAIKKLLIEKQGQVAGAFEKEGLGDIDLVWGEVDKKLNGYGLSKIEAKHLNDFANFNGANPTEKMINGINEIIDNGKVKIDQNGRATIIHTSHNNKIYKIGLKQNWKGGPTTNKWLITAYDDIREADKIINSKGFTKGETLPLNSNIDIIPQNIDNINPASEAQNFFKTLSEYNNLRDNIAKNNKKIDNEHFTLSKSIHNEINGNLSKIFNLVKERDIAAKSRLKKLETMFKFKGVTGNEALKDYLDDLTLIHFNSFSKEELDFIKLTKDKIIKSQGDILAGANKARSFRYGNLDTADDLKNKVFKLFSDLNIKVNNFFELEPLLLSHSAKENELRHIVSLDTVSNARLAMEKEANITPIKEFGTNYAEFYHDGSNAIKKLLIEKQGQVAGAFEKEGKDITLVWGIEGTSHSDGYGLSKIAKYHPEAVDNLDNIISKGEFYKDEKGRLNIKYNDDIVGLRENWLGNETVPWIISSYTKKAETSKGFNSASSITPSKENYSFTTQHNNIIPQNTKFDNTPTFLNKYPKLIDDLKWDKTLKFSSAPKSKEELKARQAFLNEFKILSSKEKIDIKI